MPPAAFLDAGRPVRGGTEVTVEDRVLRVTNLDKVLYPEVGFTKRDVIEYLVHIAPVLLPHLRDRPLTLKRYPNGVDAGHFFEKNSPKHRPDWVGTATVQMNSKTIDFTLAQDIPTLVWLGNLADLELHTSLSKAPDVARPTMLVFDLDPGPPATVVECCRVALWLQGMFEGLGLADGRQDVGQQGHAGLPAAQQRPRHVRGHEAVREGGGRAARAAGGRARRLAHDEEPAAGQGARRLEPERREEDDGERLLATRTRAPDGVDAAVVGRGPRVRAGRRSGPARLRRQAGPRARRARRRPLRRRGEPASRSCRAFEAVRGPPRQARGRGDRAHRPLLRARAASTRT